MNAERLLLHFERIAEAPDAIARLRRFILDLAVRARLVPQDPRDEPASELLKRIASDDARLTKVSRMKELTSSLAITNKDEPFELPEAWRWVRFTDIADFQAGRTPSRNNASFWGGGDPWISIADMEDGKVLTTTKETVSAKARTHVFQSEPDPPGTIVMSFKLTIGKIARLGIAAFHNEAIISVTPKEADLDGYLFKVLPQFARQGNTKGAIKGATLNRDSISSILIPLPPVPEQRRIVAKVDELMSLCDQLEAARAKRETTRDRLAVATLARLSAPDPDPTTLASHARFALNALPFLAARPDQIKRIRQTILNLAVHGKLVSQDPNDESAATLLRAIESERAVYSRTNGIAMPVHTAITEAPSSVPLGWVATHLGALFKVITDGDHQPPPRADEGVAFLTIGNITTGKLDFTDCRLVPESYYQTLAPYRTPKEGDVLYTVVGATYGRPALVETDRDFCVQRHIAILKPATKMNLRFLVWLLASPMIYEQASKCTTGSAQPTIGLRPLRNFVVNLPPLAEQYRIVAKVDQLMMLCDRLEAQLTITQTESRRLLDALLHESLAV